MRNLRFHIRLPGLPAAEGARCSLIRQPNVAGELQAFESPLAALP